MAVKEFTVEDKLRALHRLQEVYSKLDEIAILKGELPIEVSDLEDEIAGLEKRTEKLQAELDGFDADQASKKQRIKEAEALIKKYDEQLQNVKNNREYEALSKEIELQNLEIQLTQKRMRDAEGDVEAKRAYLDEAKTLIATKKEELEAKKGELDKIIKETEKEEKAYHKELEKARGGVDERLLNAFTRIRKSYRNGLAVVTISREACGGCFAGIPPQRKLEIRARKKIIICEHCGRILVDEEIAGGGDE